MGYELEQLLVIRARREDEARGKLQTARQAVSRAEADLEARREDLRTYEETRCERRDRIYAAIMGRNVRREEIELAREGVARIDKEGVLKADNVAQAQAELERRRDEAREAKAAYVATAKDRTKISEHKADWLRTERRDAECRQNAELEDFTGKKVNDDRDE